jgi:hypothetical protein
VRFYLIRDGLEDGFEVQRGVTWFEAEDYIVDSARIELDSSASSGKYTTQYTRNGVSCALGPISGSDNKHLQLYYRSRFRGDDNQLYIGTICNNVPLYYTVPRHEFVWQSTNIFDTNAIGQDWYISIGDYEAVDIDKCALVDRSLATTPISDPLQPETAEDYDKDGLWDLLELYLASVASTDIFEKDLLLEIDYLDNMMPNQNVLNYLTTYYKQTFNINVRYHLEHVTNAQIQSIEIEYLDGDSHINHKPLPNTQHIPTSAIDDVEKRFHDYSPYQARGLSFSVYIFYANIIYSDVNNDGDYDSPEPYSDWDFDWEYDDEEFYTDVNDNNIYDSNDAMVGGISGSNCGAFISKGLTSSQSALLSQFYRPQFESMIRDETEQYLDDYAYSHGISNYNVRITFSWRRNIDQLTVNAEKTTLLHELGHCIHIGEYDDYILQWPDPYPQHPSKAGEQVHYEDRFSADSRTYAGREKYGEIYSGTRGDESSDEYDPTFDENIPGDLKSINILDVDIRFSYQYVIKIFFWPTIINSYVDEDRTISTSDLNDRGFINMNGISHWSIMGFSQRYPMESFISLFQTKQQYSGEETRTVDFQHKWSTNS